MKKTGGREEFLTVLFDDPKYQNSEIRYFMRRVGENLEYPNNSWQFLFRFTSTCPTLSQLRSVFYFINFTVSYLFHFSG